MGLIFDIFTQNRAEHAQRESAQKGIDAAYGARDAFLPEAQQARDQNVSAWTPYAEGGASAFGRATDMTTPGHQFSALEADPGYEWRLQQGVNAADAGASRAGSLNSGGQQKALLRYGQGYGSQEFGNVFDRNMRVADIGTRAVAGQQQARDAYTSAAGNARFRAADAARQGYTAQGDATAGFWGGVNGSVNSTANTFARLLGAF